MITKDMTIGEIIKAKPEAAEILATFGMGCVFCPSASVRNSRTSSYGSWIRFE